MKKFKNVLKSSDIFGNIVGFKYEGDDRIKSVLGGCLTVLLLIITIVIVIIRFVNWGSNDYNLEVKTSSFNKDLSFSDNFNSTFFGFRLGVLELNKDGRPTTLGELNPIGDSSINQVTLAAKPYLLEHQNKIGSIINCYENKENNMLPLFIKFQDDSFKETYKNFLCSNISKETNITLGSDFVVANQSDYIEANLIFDICKVTPKCTDHNALYTKLTNDFRLLFSLNNQFFDKHEHKGYKTSISSYMYHRMDFNKDLVINVIVTKNIIITDPNHLFTIFPTYSNEFYSYQAVISETNRPADLNNVDRLLKVKIVFRDDDQDVANIATLLFAIYFVCKLLLFFFKKGNLTLSLLNKIYKFKEEDNSIINYEAFQSINGIESILGQKNKIDIQDNINQERQGIKDKQNPKNNITKIEIDHSLANLNMQNESQQDNPLRIELKVKESSDIQKENDKDKTNNSISKSLANN